MLLSAGFGTRLRPLTNNTPKCLVEINGQPILQIWLEKLARLGVHEVLINTHYLSDQVISFVKQYESSMNIIVAHEEVLLGTAGTVLKNSSFVDTDCFLVHTDTYIQDHLEGFVSFHRQREILMFSAVGFKVRDPSNYGTFTLDDAGIISGFYEKVIDPPSNLASAACFLIRPVFIEWMKKTNPNALDFSSDILTKALCLGGVYETSLPVFDIGTIPSLRACERYVNTAID